jgi:hypothetical protein
MATTARIVFARDAAANIVGASDVFASSRVVYFCVACGKELQPRVSDDGLPYFTHGCETTCPLAAHYALRAAAQHILLESRFIKVPHAAQARDAGIQTLLVQWTDSIADFEVVRVPVDFLAETARGQLIVEIVIPGLPPRVPLERVEKLEVPALVVSLPDPALIKGWAALRQCVLHSVENKKWLVPMERTLRRSPSWPGEASHVATVVGVAPNGSPSSWTSPLDFADNAFYRQLNHAEQLEVLQTQMALSCDRWPADVDIEIPGEGSFGVDRRVWQADVFSHFVLPASTDSLVREVACADVLRYLTERYWVDSDQEKATRAAVIHYLQRLVERGALLPLIENLEEPTYVVATRRMPATGDDLTWVSHATLSASQLRVLSVQAGLKIPIDLVQELLESFDDCHPNVAVDRYAVMLARKLHAPPRSVLGFLRDAGLVVEDTRRTASAAQEPLF